MGSVMDEAALWEWVSQAEKENPGALQQMIAAGLFDDTSSLNKTEIAQGAGMSSQPAPQGQNVGRTYIASNPLEHLAYAIQRGQGLRQIKDAQSAQADAIKKKGVGMDAMIRAMAKQPTPPPMSGGPVQAPVDPMDEPWRGVPYL